MVSSDSARISPTAHYIAYLKHRGGVAAPQLSTAKGRLIHHLLWPLMLAGQVLGGIDVERVIVARHRGLDHLLAEAIDAGSITQVIELAAGLSSRGHEFMARYAERGLVYIEGDLAEISACKREALAALGPLAPNHHVVELDALLDAGPTSLVEVGRRWLDPGRGTAVIYEGLAPYIDREATLGLWRRIADALAPYAHARLITEVYFPADVVVFPLFRVIRGVFAGITRGRIHLPFEDIEEVATGLEHAGFARPRVERLGPLLAALELDGDPDRMPVHIVSAELDR